MGPNPCVQPHYDPDLSGAKYGATLIHELAHTNGADGFSR